MSVVSVMSRYSNLILAASLAVCVSCAKQEMRTGDQPSGGPAHGDFDYITAVGPGSQARTVVSGGTKVLWSDADKIGMYAGTSTTAVFLTTLEEPSAQARFGRTSTDKPLLAGDDRYYAVYPSTAVTKWSVPASGSSAPAPFCSVNIPKLQTAEPGSWDKKAAILVASSQTNTLAFRHAVAYLRFEVTAQTGSFVTVRGLSNNNEMLTDSQAGVKFLAPDTVQVAPSTSAVDYVTLQNAESGTAFAEGAYYIAVLPGDYTQGITLSFTDAEGKVADKSIGAVTLNPGEVADWGPVTALSFAPVATPLEKSTLYIENNDPQGVVFWVNTRKPEQGKIVSGEALKLKWHVSKELFDDAWYFDTDLSQDNHDYIVSWPDYKADKAKYQAVYFCDTLRGGGWRLPSKDEFDEIYRAWTGYTGDLVGNTAYHTTTTGAVAAARFDGLLSQCVENSKMAMEATTWYWTGQGDFSTNKIRRTKVSSNYSSGAAKATGENWVRCVRDVGSSGEPASGKKTRVSLIGDSISTYEGYIPEIFNQRAKNDTAFYYPAKGNLTSVTQQYWYKLIYSHMSNAVLDLNNSWRGTMITRRLEPGYENMDYSARVAMYGLGRPDVILIHGGTNDCTTHTSYAYRPYLYRGDLLLSDSFLSQTFSDDNRFVNNPAYDSEPYKGMAPASFPSDDEFAAVFIKAEAATTWDGILALEDRSFIHGYVKLVNMIHFRYPEARVVMIIGNKLTASAEQAVLKIAARYSEKYGYKCVDFFPAEEAQHINEVHPDADGFTYMARRIYEEAGTYIDLNKQ